ncbi:hypothetical protein TNCV_3916081 [Trichonephila clavipes]|nr:hypothetical protein TNCV_3916081 [Trichonephila clavipes]
MVVRSWGASSGCDGALSVLLIILLGYLWGQNGHSFQGDRLGIAYVGTLSSKWRRKAKRYAKHVEENRTPVGHSPREFKMAARRESAMERQPVAAMGIRTERREMNNKID